MGTSIQSDHKGGGGQHRRLLRGPIEKVADGASSQHDLEGVVNSGHDVERPKVTGPCPMRSIEIDPEADIARS